MRRDRRARPGLIDLLARELQWRKRVYALPHQALRRSKYIDLFASVCVLVAVCAVYRRPAVDRTECAIDCSALLLLSLLNRGGGDACADFASSVLVFSWDFSGSGWILFLGPAIRLIGSWYLLDDLLNY